MVVAGGLAADGSLGGDGLQLRGVAVGYPSRHRWPQRGLPTVVVNDISAVARPGQLTAVLGPNGAGKSTLLRSLVGLQPLLTGSVNLDGTDLLRMRPSERARRVAVGLTDRVDGGLLTGREVVELGRHPHRTMTSRRTAYEQELIMSSLERLRAAPLADRRFAELSDGQRQRVLLARALVQEPELLVLDEPSAFLDVGARVDLMALLTHIAVEEQIPILISTHEVELALRMAQRIWLIHESRLVSGDPDELIRAGAISRTFETASAHFDPATRTFVLRPSPGQDG